MMRFVDDNQGVVVRVARKDSWPCCWT